MQTPRVWLSMAVGVHKVFGPNGIAVLSAELVALLHESVCESPLTCCACNFPSPYICLAFSADSDLVESASPVMLAHEVQHHLSKQQSLWTGDP